MILWKKNYCSFILSLNAVCSQNLFGMNVLDIYLIAFILKWLVFTFFLKKTKLKKMAFYSRRLALDDLRNEMDCGFHKKISVCDDYISFLQ